MTIDLQKVLEETGYITNNEPAPGVIIGADAQSMRRGRKFVPDALWRSSSSLTIYFKYTDTDPCPETVATWRQEIWNEGYTPLFWVISPGTVNLYSGYGKPIAKNDAEQHRIQTFRVIEEDLRRLNDFAGRLAMETGQFWLHPDAKCCGTRVDQQLLRDLYQLEKHLTVKPDGLPSDIAQALVGRCIFTKYLIDRGIISTEYLVASCGKETLQAALRDGDAAQNLFKKLKTVFNGDMFPEASAVGIRTMGRELALVADFLEGTDLSNGQRSLFPYQFDLIPIELISSIYEQFAHSATPKDDSSTIEPEARLNGVHYTPLTVVSLILNEVIHHNITGDETVLDLTCGSGIFLVESLRRLVAIKSAGKKPSRHCIRETLYNQIFGIDCSEAAIRVAAFSLYLAAIELDPEPYPPEVLKFDPLIGKSLFIGDAHSIENTPDGAPLRHDNGLRNFDIIVGNPPWTFKGKTGTAARRGRRRKDNNTPILPRSESQDFVHRALDFAHGNTRFGIILDATPFFASSDSGCNASQRTIEMLSPATIVNLSALPWLFPTATKPAVAVLGRCRRPDTKDGIVTLVNVRWSASGEKSKTFTIAPSDIVDFRIDDWIDRPEILKAKIYGHDRDLKLLSRLQNQMKSLGIWLSDIGTELRDGLILGAPSNRTRESKDLIGLDVVESSDMSHFNISDGLDAFPYEKAEWPRNRDIYRSPIVLIKEFFRGSPRPIAAVAKNDVVFTDAFFGASFHKLNPELANLLAAILNSSLATWFFLMASSEFGIWKRRLLKKEVEKLPLPDMEVALNSNTAKRLFALMTSLHNTSDSSVFVDLDEAVFDLYGLDEEDRILVRDAYVRAGWQWEKGRNFYAQPANTNDDLKTYSETFVKEISKWLQVRNVRSLAAEIYDLPRNAPIRIVRFALNERPSTPSVQIITPSHDLQVVLDDIGRQIKLPISSSILGEREVRANGNNEVIMIKPAARRFWMKSIALRDVDDLIKESFHGIPQ
ncbi:N-6 DNA methylase [Geobacter hydrogenophilus]|uniref:DNA methylase adenine-specific domain-containing protein n=1 Tax=Geobacter hydrogenophilus TaxID=40983 RepID=A0A9W6FZ95_9BACT|nr:N-6 DNA methylase [Geobacter hydrogenophilus]MBT0893752.1 N-6 DNA methylase [Geobacter hydrogenophilus]GLI37552.1 hypothetical protein GHYDROH2_10530 [Geobacter hydrogenophilus]